MEIIILCCLVSVIVLLLLEKIAIRSKTKQISIQERVTGLLKEIELQGIFWSTSSRQHERQGCLHTSRISRAAASHRQIDKL